MTTGNAMMAADFSLQDPSSYFSDKTASMMKAALAADGARVHDAVQQGADPNEEAPTGGSKHIRPLHYAVAANNPRAAQLLFGVGSDPELRAAGTGSALMFAVSLDNAPMLNLLLELKPVALLTRDTQENLLFSCVERSRGRCLEVLLQRGVPIDLADSAGKTIFMHALNMQRYEVAEWILLRGAAVSGEPTLAGITPANVLQYHLGRVREGTASHQKLQRIQQLMEARGVRFPVPTPQEIRNMRGKH